MVLVQVKDNGRAGHSRATSLKSTLLGIPEYKVGGLASFVYIHIPQEVVFVGGG